MNVMESVLNEKIDPYLTEESVRRVVARALERDVRVREIETLTGGCWNRVIGVAVDGGPDVVLKINPEKDDPGIKREFQVLSAFAEKTRMPVPTPYAVDTSEDPIPGTVLVMKRVDGVVLHHAFGRMSERGHRDVLDQVIRHVIDLHTVKGSTFGGVEAPGTGDWASFWLSRFDRVMTEIEESGHVGKPLLDRVYALRERFPEVLTAVKESTLTHYDIWSGNVMVSPRNGTADVTGFIDIPGYRADYARELSFMAMFGMLDAEALAQYAAVHRLDDGFELRMNVYNLKMHLKHIVMYPNEAYYREGAESCAAFIRRAVV